MNFWSRSSSLRFVVSLRILPRISFSVSSMYPPINRVIHLSINLHMLASLAVYLLILASLASSVDPRQRDRSILIILSSNIHESCHFDRILASLATLSFFRLISTSPYHFDRILASLATLSFFRLISTSPVTSTEYSLRSQPYHSSV